MSETLTLGVLGGMGPAATLDFLARLHALTPAHADADHLRVICDNNPKVPDPNAPGTAAGVVLAEMAGALQGCGAQVLAMPCNTAHAHADLIQSASGLPLIDMIGLGAGAAAAGGALRCGVLGSRGALRLYREYLAARAVSLILHDVDELSLGADEENVLAAQDDIARESLRHLQLTQCLLEIDDVDAVALREDETTHLRVPAAGLVSEVDTRFE